MVHGGGLSVAGGTGAAGLGFLLNGADSALTLVSCTAINSRRCAPRPVETLSPALLPPAGSDERPELTPGPFPKGPSPGMGYVGDLSIDFQNLCYKHRKAILGLIILSG